jgi:hypothetical protein
MPSVSTNGRANKNGKKVDARALLKAAAKAPVQSKRNSPFDYDGNLEAVAGKILALTQQKDEIEREIGLARDEIRRTVDPWYQELLKANGYEHTVRVPAGKVGTLRITYTARYYKLLADREGALREAVGDSYDDYFRPGAKLKVRKEITDDPERLAEVVVQLGEALGANAFQEVFEAEQTILPTKLFTENRYRDLDPEQNAKLTMAGVCQVVSMGGAK